MKFSTGVALSALSGLLSLACDHEAHGPDEPLTGKEHLAWNQHVPNPSDLERYRFAVYVDSTRVELPDAGCNAPSDWVALCTARIPSMDPGEHRLALVTYMLPERVDSPKAAPILVTVARRVP